MCDLRIVSPLDKTVERLPLFHDSFILPSASASHVLLLRDVGGWALPQWVHLARYGRTARELDAPFWPAGIQEELRRRLGIETTVLHAGLHDVRDPSTGDRHTVFVLENHCPRWTPPTGARWVGRDELAGLPLAISEHRFVLEAWYAEAEGDGTSGDRPPWQRPGWFAIAIAWVAEQLCRHGAATVGPAEQLGTKVARFLMRVRTTEGTAYFKAVPAMYCREYHVLGLLHAKHPAHVPELLAGDTDRHWIMTRGREGTNLSQVDDLGAWEAALHAFARIQIACAAHTEALLTAGCTDLALETLEAQFLTLLSDGDALLVGEPSGLSLTDVDALRALAPSLRRACERLASHALPPSLVHNDLLPANVVVETDGSPVFFDWCEATVSHPFFSPVRFLASATWKGEPVGSTPELYARLRGAYLQRWTVFEPAEKLVEAFGLARALQPVHHALTYWHLYRFLAAEGGMHQAWERRGVAALSLKRLLDQRALLQQI